MELIILGSGTIASDKNCSSYLVKIKNRFRLLDLGTGAYLQLIKVGIDLERISDIFITHTHVDHVNDLPALLWRFMFGIGRKNQLNIFGPKGFCRFFTGITKQYPAINNTKFRIAVTELYNKTIRLGDINVIARNVSHGENSNAYRIEHLGKSIAYSGDTDYCSGIIKISKNADILILECSNPDNKKADGHLSPKLCSKIASSAHVKNLVLTHLYPECEKINIKEIIKKEKDFKGRILIAKESMRLRC